MPKMPERSEAITPSAERSRKARAPSMTRGKSNPITQVSEPDPDWHKVAMMMWHSALASGGAAYFEESDVAVLYFICDQIDYLYRVTSKGEPRNRSPEMVKTILAGLGNLLATEGDRRRLHMELQKSPDDDDTFLADLRNMFSENEDEDE